MVQTLAELANADRALLIAELWHSAGSDPVGESGKAQTCFIMNKAQKTELASWINFHFYSVYLDCLHLKS